MRTTVKMTLAAAALSVLSAGAAPAATLSLDYLGAASGYRYLKIEESPVEPIGGGALPDWVLSGAFKMRDTTAGSALGTFIAWCLDISHWLGTGGSYPYETTATPFASSYGLSAAQKSRIQGFFDANYYAGLEDDRERSAGFQMGLWEALYDDDFSLTLDSAATDDFRGSAGDGNAVTAFGLAGGYLAAAAGYTGPKKWTLTFLESLSGRQNLVTVSPVPVPAGGLLLMTGLAGLAVAARRRRG